MVEIKMYLENVKEIQAYVEFAETIEATRKDTQDVPGFHPLEQLPEGLFGFVRPPVCPEPGQTITSTTPLIIGLQNDTPAPIPTEAEVVAAVKDMLARTSYPEVVALLKEFGVPRAGELAPEQRAAFIGRTQEKAPA